MNKITGVITAAAAAAMLSINPLAAQESDQAQGTANQQIESQLGINQDERLEATETFRTMDLTPSTVAFDATVGATVPDTVVTEPVPQEIVAVAPGVEGYHYVALPDDRIAIVDPQTNVVIDLF